MAGRDGPWMRLGVGWTLDVAGRMDFGCGW